MIGIRESIAEMSECLVVKDGHSNGVPAVSRQFTESDRAVLAQLFNLQLPKKEIAARLNTAVSVHSTKSASLLEALKPPFRVNKHFATPLALNLS